MPNFRVPAGSQSGGNPKKKRRTSQNTATPVTNAGNDMGPPNMMGGPMEPNTMYAGMNSEKFIKKCLIMLVFEGGNDDYCRPIQT